MTILFQLAHPAAPCNRFTATSHPRQMQTLALFLQWWWQQKLFRCQAIRKIQMRCSSALRTHRILFFSRINDADICFKIVTITQADGHHSKKATPPSSVNDPDIQDRLPDITNTIDQRSYESNSVLKPVETHSGNKKPSWCPASNKSGW